MVASDLLELPEIVEYECLSQVQYCILCYYVIYGRIRGCWATRRRHFRVFSTLGAASSLNKPVWSYFRLCFFEGRARTGGRPTSLLGKPMPIAITPPYVVGTRSHTAGTRDHARVTLAHLPGTRDLGAGTLPHVVGTRDLVVGTLPHVVGTRALGVGTLPRIVRTLAQLARNGVTIDSFRNPAHAAGAAHARGSPVLVFNQAHLLTTFASLWEPATVTPRALRQVLSQVF